MPDENKNLNDGPKKNGQRHWVVWILPLFCVMLGALYFAGLPSSGGSITQSRFEQLVDSNLIVKAELKLNSQSQTEDITGTYQSVDKNGNREMNANGSPVTIPFQANVYLTPERLQELLDKPMVRHAEPPALLVNLIETMAPFLLIGSLPLIGFLVWFFLVRQVRMAGKGA